jgi:hypothetical protein
MPIIGNLSEFPLPEVLYDVPEFGIMDVDFSNGEVQAMQLGKQQLTDAEEMIAKLSAVVQTQAGMFEFRIHPVASVPRDQPVLVNRLVMTLVYYVDEQLRQHNAIVPTHWYIAEAFRPDVWMEPELYAFFLQAQTHLVTGVHADELAKRLGVPVTEAHQKLRCLCQLGFVRVIDGAEIEKMREAVVQKQVTQKTTQFQIAAEANDLIKRTGKLIEIMQKRAP